MSWELAADINVPLSLGVHTVQLTIGDDNNAPTNSLYCGDSHSHARE